MDTPFVDRPPTESEIERFRLFLSSYQDRLGNIFNDEPVYPWIFEDVVIAAFNLPTEVQVSPGKFPSAGPQANREGNYQIRLKSLFSDKLEDFCRKNLIRSFDPSKYWDYLAQFGITQQNFKENPVQASMRSLDLVKSEEKNLFEKIFYLFLFVDQDYYYSEDRKKEFCFSLAQYCYPIDAYHSDPTTLQWLVSEEPDLDARPTLQVRRNLATFFRGYENNELVYEIKIPTVEPQPLPRSPLPSQKKQKITRKSMLKYAILSDHSDLSIKIRIFFPSSKRVWQSDLLQVEKLSKLQIMEYGAIAAIKKQRECAVTQLEDLIKSDAKEEAFQQLLEKNWWMFGNEYGEVIGQREIALGTQQDFLAKRTADGFLEIIEIKKPLNGKNLIYKTNGNHPRSHYRQELSDAIAQVIDYIDEIENDKHSIYYKEKIEVEKIRARIIIGRDGDEKQKRSLRHLNSALHGIEILTYDQLLRIAKKSLEYQ